MENDLPVLIIGAGISGLLLAQQLRQLNIPFQIFERDNDFSTRGSGWGLTLHWSLPALRKLLPEDLLSRLPDTYVDRAAVERGESSTFPFFDLTTGEKKGASPRAGENERIRVTREGLRRLLATSIDIQWGKTFKDLSDYTTSVGAHFADGTEYRGRILFGCDGSHSQVRRGLFSSGKYDNHRIPVSMFGFAMQMTAAQAKPIRELDPFFLQGTASASNVFMYISLLKAPQHSEKDDEDFVYQICISGSTDREPFHSKTIGAVELTNSERIAIIRDIAQGLAEPFHSFLSLVSNDTKVQILYLDDFEPRKEMFAAGTYTLVGDSAHAMAMSKSHKTLTTFPDRGEGANHAIVDVLELRKIVLSKLSPTAPNLRFALHEYQQSVAKRTLPAVLASRQACLDAHNWANLTPKSPLLTRRQMILDYDG
ncbi:FAD binding domain-containing protein [Macroventuria anomochaeta]|uniref:FAD binding domain-containing protein n=1 Tax=Macroventuria anomochaeta TaxID=301207 RepID=A0ACB6RRN3_9PLEO|nr:FAD binding domain-containing protein [Macroventuria anomochaeta]KAF2624362.1 FAD binding domain-containing protein [Macroventuria anomochaeta]